MFCRHCGAQIPQDSKFCMQCGKSTGVTAENDSYTEYDYENIYEDDQANTSSQTVHVVHTRQRGMKWYSFVRLMMLIEILIGIFMLFRPYTGWVSTDYAGQMQYFPNLNTAILLSIMLDLIRIIYTGVVRGRLGAMQRNAIDSYKRLFVMNVVFTLVETVSFRYGYSTNTLPAWMNFSMPLEYSWGAAFLSVAGTIIYMESTLSYLKNREDLFIK